MTRLVTRARKRASRASLVVLIALIRSLSAVLPYRIAVALGGTVGFLSYYLIPRDRKRATDHLARSFPERERSWIERTARGSFVHLGKALLELMKVSPGDLDRVVEFTGKEKLDAALAQGKGVVYVAGHIGNWELMGAAVAAHGPLSVVAAPIEPEAVNEQIVGLRARLGVKTILRSRSGAAKELIRVFRENRILGILIDQDTDVEGAFVPFFGAPAWTPTAAAQMAIKFGAAVVFGFIRRGPTGHHRVTIEGPLDLQRTGNDTEDIMANTARFTAMIEETVRACPEQWVWMHRRWRKRP